MSLHETPKYVRWTLWTGVTIAIISVATAFAVVWSARGGVQSLGTQLAGTAEGYEALAPDSSVVAERSEIRALLVASTIVSYDQSLRTAALALATSILSIGFALFVMGVESAYKAGASAGSSSFRLEAASPGLLCFTLATILILIVAARGADIKHLTQADSNSATAPDMTSTTPPRPIPQPSAGQ